MERVDVQDNDKRGIRISENSVLGVWSGGATITGNGLNTDGWDGYGPGLEIDRNSTASVDRLTVSGNGRGVSVSRGSIFSGGSKDENDSSLPEFMIVIKDNKIRGISANDNSNLDLKHVQIDSNGSVGITDDDGDTYYEPGLRLDSGSSANIREGTLSSNSGYGIRMDDNARLDLRNMTVDSNGRSGIKAYDGSHLYLNSVTLSNNGGSGLRIENNSEAHLVAVTQGGSSRFGLDLYEHSIAHINDSETSSTLGKVNVDQESEVQISEDAQATLSEVSLNRGAHLQFYGSTPTSTVDSVTCWNQTTTSGQSIYRPTVIFFDNGDNSTVSSIGSDCGVVQ